MRRISTISQEFLQVGGNKHTGLLILGQVEALLKHAEQVRMLGNSDMHALQATLREQFKLNITIELSPYDYSSIRIHTLNFPGHQGIGARFYQGEPTDISSPALDDKLLTGIVDLDKGQVGGFFSDLPFTLIIPTVLFTATERVFTAEEITALILHEVGHAFFTCATLGEYVWLNYYLADGVDVLLKKKPNRYKVELLNLSYLTKQVSDPALAEKLKNDPSEADLRRALLVACHKDNRNHLTTRVVKGAIKRSEQLADLFAARLGFTRALVTALDKAQRMSVVGRRYQRNRIQFVLGEVLKLISGVGSVLLAFPTAGVSLLWLIALYYDSYSDANYDNPTERIEKLRRELVTQLRSGAFTPTEKAALDADLKAVDAILKNRNQYDSIWEGLVLVLHPGRRREHHRLKHEQLLEQLLSNDLFVQAHRFQTLT